MTYQIEKIDAANNQRLLFTLESVSTDQLKDGDLIITQGALLKLEGREDELSKWGRIGSYPEYGPCIWFKGILQDGIRGAIPGGWFDRLEDGRLSWTVQGNSRASWGRVLSVETHEMEA